ncbi:MAG: hypothetical protein M1837_006311 [Sclerophora amabilis]|nr:MAG: hypothetical protein M1837_006311 [Sclerophora amabilis]
MLAWLQNPPRDSGDRRVENVPDRSQRSLPDPPETPAPVFAIRALKTAIFGTPSEVRDRDTFEQIPAKSGREGAKSTRAAITRNDALPSREVEKEENVQSDHTSKEHDPSSPIKPTGILLTPGTGANRRKTVSFGEAVLNNEGKRAEIVGRSGLPEDCPGKYPSPWTPKTSITGKSTKPTSLTQSLYKARDRNVNNAGQDSESDSDPALHSLVPHDRQGGQNIEVVKGSRRVGTQQEDIGNVTIDLDDPKSSSGQYWKSEFEGYQARAGEQMRKVIKYKEMAKSYAKKKDLEATDLGEKLREEKLKVTQMEQELSQLAGQVMSRLGDGKDGSYQPDMMKELARQTALSLQYKAKVDQFESALTDAKVVNTEGNSDNARSQNPSRTEQTLIKVEHELQQAKNQVKEMAILRTEVDMLKSSLQSAERRAATLDREKTSLITDLTRLKESFDESESRRKAQEERHRSKVASVEAEMQEYKRKCLEFEAKRKSAEYQARKGPTEHSSKQALSSNLIASDLGMDKLDRPLELKNCPQTDEKQDGDLQPDTSELPTQMTTRPYERQSQQRKTAKALRGLPQRISTMRLKDQKSQDYSQQAENTVERARSHYSPFILNNAHGASTAGNSPKNLKRGLSDTTYSAPSARAGASRPRDPSLVVSSALKDLNINTSYDYPPSPVKAQQVPLNPRSNTNSYQFSPQPHFDPFLLDLPSPEVSPESDFKAARKRKNVSSSPRPSMVMPLNIGGSGESDRLTNMTTGRRDLRSRGSQKPQEGKALRNTRAITNERAAAARARLELKNAERRRVQEMNTG